MFKPENVPHKHTKKCVLGVFLKYTRIERLALSLVIVLFGKNGAQGRNHAFQKYHLNIVG